MTLWDMAMTVREFAKKRPITFARLSLGWPGEAYEFDGPLSFMGNDGGGGVGTGPGHSIGAALALKDSGRLTVGVIGDGDYLMGVQALWTAAHFDIPVMIVVADNRSYFNDEMHQERVAQMREPPGAESLDRPAHRRSARGFGRDGARPRIRQRGAGIDDRSAGESTQEGRRDRRQGRALFHRFGDRAGLCRQRPGSARGRREKIVAGRNVTA